LLESWNAGWTWVAPNILLSFSLIRIVRPYVQILAQHHWAAFALLVCALYAVLPTEDCRGRCSAYTTCMSTADQLPT
jgi:hypothetical protein